VTLFAASETIAEARVFGGEVGRVPLRADGPVRVTLPKGERPDIRAQAIYRGPVEAPIRDGQPVGTLQITARQDGRLLAETKLYAAADVTPGSIPERAWDALADLILRRIW
jgi:D-alanyl-D-alanine carboxypeptidase (penicillin-binding protein 5/6)